MAHILVIDDDILVRKAIRAVLECAGHEVVLAPDGRDGMREYGKNAIDLIITDILMPEQDGVETILTLRKTNPAVKILATSGGARIGNQDFLLLAKRLGATAILRKPFEPDDLVAQVAALCH